MSRAVRIGVTAGCPCGIGPEVLARALVDAKLPRGVRICFFGSPELLLLGAKRARARAKFDGTFVHIGGHHVDLIPSAPSSRARAGDPGDDDLRVQRDNLKNLCIAAAAGSIDAMVTGPVRKRALDIDGVLYPGQTEIVHAFLAVDDKPPLMVFAGAPFLLGLATVHIPLVEVSRAITPALLDAAIERLRDAARAILRIREPRIVLFGVNPHAGEGGLFGTEEIDVVAPAAKRHGALGPVPADGFFADVARGAAVRCDAVLAMHHDQGLAPYKLLAGGKAVNVTWGCKIPRTSPDHGTADRMAGTGRASSSSMRAALELAAQLARDQVAAKVKPVTRG